jgi:hypothetical protein
MICRSCPKETTAKDGFCKGCRLVASSRERQKYFWSPEMDAKLRHAYEARNKRLLGIEISALMHHTGWPRYIFQNRAQLLGLHVYSSTRWEQWEIDSMRDAAGTIPAYKIAKILHRSELAVRNKLYTLGLESALREGFSINQLCQLFGTRHAKIDRWIGRGWLTVNDDDRISHYSVTKFVWEHMDEYRFAACEEWWLKQMLKPLHRVIPSASFDGRTVSERARAA